MGEEVAEISRFEPGDGSKHITGQDGSGQPFFKCHGSGRVGSSRPTRSDPTRKKTRLVSIALYYLQQLFGITGFKWHKSGTIGLFSAQRAVVRGNDARYERGAPTVVVIFPRILNLSGA